MASRAWYRGLLALVVVYLAAAGAAQAQGFTAPKLVVRGATSVDQVRPGDSFEITATLQLPREAHVNAHVPGDPNLIPTEVRLAPPSGIRIGEVSYPAPVRKSFSFTPKPIAVYEGRVEMRAQATAAKDLRPGALTVKGTLSAQACNNASCFAPTTLGFSIPIEVVPAGAAAAAPDPEPRAATGTQQPSSTAAVPAGTAGVATRYPTLNRFVTAKEFLGWLKQSSAGSDAPGGGEGGDRLGALIRGGNWLLALPLIFLAGLALNLTPCVYPLIPITIGFFAGQSGGSRRHVLGLASFYVLGMAAMYSTLGVLAAMTNQLFGGQLQNPYVLGGFAAVMFALGLSMFGLWEFRLPSGIANRVSGRGGLVGALVMGLLVGFVAAPCIGPVVVALLQVVSALGDPAVGFGVFFALALGLGVPYLLLGVSSGLIQRLPRSGEWMNAVKRVFGLAMFGMALYYLGPLMGESAHRVVLSLYVLGAGAYLALLDSSGRSLRRFLFAKRGLGVAAIVAGAAMLVPQPQAEGIPFAPYSDQEVRDALAQGRGVLIDFRADWCAACRELEAKTFRDPEVVAAASDLVVLKQDMTRWDDPEARRLKEAYGILGLPTVVFIAPSPTAAR